MGGWSSLIGMGGISGITSAGGSSGGSWLSGIGNALGGWGNVIGGIAGALGGGGGSSGGGSSNTWGNIFQGLLGGLGGAMDAQAQQRMTREENEYAKERIRISSEEQRRNIGFAADMDDYYKQKDKVRRRAALDTYGQFSLLSRYAPNYQNTPPVDPGVRPST